MVKKVLLTGATGLIGKEAIKPLKNLGYEIYALSRNYVESNNDINYIECDLFDENSIKEVFEKIKPEYLLNFAWIAKGDYLTSPFNYKFLNAGFDLITYFKQNGGKRAVYVGTCFEYKFKDEKLKEDADISPQTTYAMCKNALHKTVEAFCQQNNISFAYGRIFYVYGHGEDKKRLTPHLIDSLKNNQRASIYYGNLVRDYMYTKDIAGAFVKLLDSNVEGTVNISTGQGISLKDFALKIADKLGKTQYLDIENRETNDPLYIIGDNTRLTKEVGYKLQYTLDKALDAIIKED